MRLTVFGASGPTGRQVLQQAGAAGHELTVLTRDASSFDTDTGLDVVEGDIADEAVVERAVDGADAVISTFGVPYTPHKVTVYSQGAKAVVQAMQRTGVDRLVCVSSASLARTEAPDEVLWWRKGVVPVLRHVLGRTLYDDMERMERIVRGSGLTWTVVRPQGLFHTDEPTRDFEVSLGRLKGHYTSRADLAKTLLDEAVLTLHPEAVIEVVTRSRLPNAFLTFGREAFKLGV